MYCIVTAGPADAIIKYHVATARIIIIRAAGERAHNSVQRSRQRAGDRDRYTRVMLRVAFAIIIIDRPFPLFPTLGPAAVTACFFEIFSIFFFNAIFQPIGNHIGFVAKSHAEKYTPHTPKISLSPFITVR